MARIVTDAMPASAVILAGGQSRRMGSDKALLQLDGQTLLARVVNRLSAVADEVLVVGGSRSSSAPPCARVVDDYYPGAGPLGGLAAGLEAARHPLVCVAACDMPFVDPAVMGWMLSLARELDVDAVVPRVRDRIEPLHAVYRRHSLPVVVAHLRSPRKQDHAVKSALSDLRVRWVGESELRRLDPGLRSLVNVNTANEWAAARAGESS